MSQKTVKQVIATLGAYLSTRQVAANHTVVVFEGGTILTSYGRNAAIIEYHNASRLACVVDGVYNYSNTTAKHVNRYLGITSAQRNQGIKAGSIEVIGE